MRDSDIVNNILSVESKKPMDPNKKKIIQNNLRQIPAKKSTVVSTITKYQIKLVQKMKQKFLRMTQIKIHYKKEEEFKDFVTETFDQYIEALKQSNSSWFKKNMSFPVVEVDCNVQYKETVLSFLNSFASSCKMKIINRDNVPPGMPVPTEHEKEESGPTTFPFFYLSHSEGYHENGQNLVIHVSLGSSFVFDNPFNKKKEKEEE